MDDSKKPDHEESLEDLLARRLGLNVRKPRSQSPTDSAPEPSSRMCYKCLVGDNETFLEPCKLCNRLFCSEHGFRANWGRFCSSTCSQTWFYGAEDEIDPDNLDANQDYD